MADTPVGASHVVAVYVREGESEDVRTLSFRPPEGISQTELLDRGYAIDGNSAVYRVSATPDGGPNNEATALMANLLFAERDLVAWLGGLGHKVEFR